MLPIINYITRNPGLLLVITAWELIWKGIGLWYSARLNQRNWFIAILVINTVGILPIIYLKFFQHMRGAVTSPKKSRKK